ncbi:hypothetical protein CPZ25_020295 [Eubacterium maltosivorans]|uniref:Uncharacterized protein n=1 Tax=Eubacterium maltosivorans TaxID=2041044 RepID=A0A4P9CF33_EUBML|nr:hypothetical protein CPZ25_020295 [Eubacterium maltosivorans]
MCKSALGRFDWICGHRPHLIKCAEHICTRTFHLQLSTFHLKKAPKGFKKDHRFFGNFLFWPDIAEKSAFASLPGVR